MQQTQQTFHLNDLTSQEVEAIMIALNELPAKQSRSLMNKLETQIIHQVQVAQSAAVPKEAPNDKE